MSTLKVHINRMYAWGEWSNSPTWVCDACGVKFFLLQTSSETRDAFGVYEVGVHWGGEYSEGLYSEVAGTHHVCGNCGVAWELEP